MAKIKRRPKPRRRHRKANEQLFCIVAYATFLIFVLIYIFSPEQEATTENDGDVFTSTKASAIRLARCRSSCDELVLSKVSASSSGPSTALATSAVDALFSIQDTHNESSTERRQASDDGQRKERIDSSARNNDFVGDDKSLLRPIQLPPLIETLIGTVDDQNVYTERYGRRNRRNTKKIIRKEGPKKTKGNATSSQRRRGDRSTNDPVQMAAAAAAAAVWSESARYWGRHRMRTLNEEWDAALRWIAGWGHQYETGHEDSFQQVHRDPERTKNTRGQTGVSSHVRDGAMQDFTLLFDTCVDECLENYAGSAQDGQWGDSLTGDILGISRDIATKLVSSLGGLKGAENFQANASIVLVSVYRIIISSLFVFAVRFLWRWWYCIPLSSSYLGESPQWLLEETGAELRSSGACNRYGQRRNLGENKKKGLSSKKGRRKRKTRNPVHHHEVPKKCTETNKTKSESSLPRCMSDNGNDGGRGVSHVESFSSIDHKEYESAKECDAEEGDASSEATCTNASLCSSSQCSEAPLLNHNEKFGKDSVHSVGSSAEGAQPFSSECINYIHANRRITTDTSDGISSMASSFMTSSTPSPILAPAERHRSERAPIDGSSDIIWQPGSTDQPKNIMKVTNSTVTSCSLGHNISGQVDCLQHDPVVPTDEQREEASRQLREFQQIQIQRIVQRKAAFGTSQQGNKPYAPHAPPLQIPVQGVSASFSPASHSVTVSPTRVRNSVIGPPPIAALSSNNASNEVVLRSHESNELETNATGCLTGDELLLSNMLDEDDEAEIADITGSPTVPPGFAGNTTSKPCMPLSPCAATLTMKPNVLSSEGSVAAVSNNAWVSQTSPVGKRNETQEPPSLSLGNGQSGGLGIRRVVGSPIGSPVLSVTTSTWSSHDTGTW